MSLQIIKEEVEKFNQEIKKDLDAKKFTDTSDAKNSLRVEVYSNGVRSIDGSKGGHIEYLNRGTRPWKGDVMKNTAILAYFLESSGWYERKVTNKEISVYQIAYSIVSKGSMVFQQRRDSIDIEKKVDQLTENINKRLIPYHKQQIIIKLNNAFKR